METETYFQKSFIFSICTKWAPPKIDFRILFSTGFQFPDVLKTIKTHFDFCVKFSLVNKQHFVKVSKHVINIGRKHEESDKIAHICEHLEVVLVRPIANAN